ncbi:MAG: hypothetical protein AB7R89_11745 [Dehalococcoidia bacterium]
MTQNANDAMAALAAGKRWQVALVAAFAGAGGAGRFCARIIVR